MNEQSGYRKWTALVAAFLIMAGPYSIINTIHSLFIHPVVNQYGFSLKSFSFVFTLSAIVIALASPAVGRAVGTIGLRPVMVRCWPAAAFLPMVSPDPLPPFMGSPP